MDGFFLSWEREVHPQLLQKYEAGVSPTQTPYGRRLRHRGPSGTPS
jgi:hypothetical protein